MKIKWNRINWWEHIVRSAVFGQVKWYVQDWQGLGSSRVLWLHKSKTPRVGESVEFWGNSYSVVSNTGVWGKGCLVGWLTVEAR